MKHEERNAANGARPALRVTGAVCLLFAVAGCTGFGTGSFYDGTIQRGYVADVRAVDTLKPGQSAEQVLSKLGTPSTTSTVGGDAWYYISQTVTRPVAFMPDRIAEQRVLAVYFGKGKKLERIANYGIEDGRLFDYMSRTTAVPGGDTGFVQNMFRNLLKFS